MGAVDTDKQKGLRVKKSLLALLAWKLNNSLPKHGEAQFLLLFFLFVFVAMQQKEMSR